MRLIDADALEKDIRELLFTEEEPSTTLTELGEAIHNSAIELALFEVVEAESIEAVPVVRCGECKHRGDPDVCPMLDEVYYGVFEIERYDVTEDNGFCHKGAKMDGGAGR